MSAGEVQVSSMVSHRTREGRVQFYLAPPKDAWTMSIEEAKHHALADAFLVAWLQDEMKLEDAQIGAMLQKFREYRQTHGLVL